MNAYEKLVQHQQTLYESSNPTRRWLHETRRDWIVDCIAQNAKASGAALEIGPGAGPYLPSLSKHFAEVVAADIEVAYLEHGQKAFDHFENIRFEADDITNTKLGRDRFDFILCSEVIEHIADSQAALAGIASILKPGGVLLLSTPQRYSPLEQTAKIAFMPGVIHAVRAIYGESIEPTGHINLMTSKVVQQQIEHVGLKVEDEHLSGVYLPLVAEFSGEVGLRWFQRLERSWRASSLMRQFLWTQYYIIRKPSQ